MKYLKCINKNKDKSNRITSYELIDTCGNKICLKSTDIKSLIHQNEIIVDGLQLTKNNRLIECSDKTVEKFNNIHTILQKYYPYEIHGLRYNDGDINYNRNKVIYFSCDYETSNCETLTIVDIWVDFNTNKALIITDQNINGKNYKIKVTSKSLSEKDLYIMIKKFLSLAEQANM